MHNLFSCERVARILNTNSPIYVHSIEIADASASMLGEEPANLEKMIHAKTIIAPSKHTPIYDFKNVIAIDCVLSEADADNGIGEIAVYI